MANSNRLFTDNDGNMFIPMAVEGGSWNDEFITTPKLVCIGGIVISGVVLGLWLSDNNAKWVGYVVAYLIWFVFVSYLVRFVILEERYFFKEYIKLRRISENGNGVTSPSIFWNIAAVNDTERGCILTYRDGKTGVLIKLDRDVIVGKEVDNKEIHYDSVSNFYNELLRKRYKFVVLNDMDNLGADDRLKELDKLIIGEKNKNLRRLIELGIGHYKNISNRTLYEREYVLVYTEDMQKVDYILDDVTKSADILLSGSYAEFTILNLKDIVSHMANKSGVKYFNYVDATLDLYTNMSKERLPFRVYGVEFKGEHELELNKLSVNKIKELASLSKNNTLQTTNETLKEIIIKLNKKNVKEVDFGDLDVVVGVKKKQFDSKVELDEVELKGFDFELEFEGETDNKDTIEPRSNTEDDEDEVIDF